MGNEDHFNSDYNFYKQFSKNFAKVNINSLNLPYTKSSHPQLTCDIDYLKRLMELIKPGGYGIDVGCGAGARDVDFLVKQGYKMIGVDIVKENVEITKTLLPHLSPLISVLDFSTHSNYKSETFDFVLCNSVIQHIPPEKVLNITIPELVRIVKHGGILLLIFKCGNGFLKSYDQKYGVDRYFQLYPPHEVSSALRRLRMNQIPAFKNEKEKLSFFSDHKNIEHCIIFTRKMGGSYPLTIYRNQFQLKNEREK